MSDPLPYVRFSSLTEAVSYLLLLCVAMPLKYVAGMPMAVRVLGMVHGILFLMLIWFSLRACVEKGWPKSRAWVLGLASLVPILPFWLDRKVRRWIQESRDAAASSSPTH